MCSSYENFLWNEGRQIFFRMLFSFTLRSNYFNFCSFLVILFFVHLSKNVFHHRFPQFFIIIIIKELMKFYFCRVFLLCYTFCVFFYTRSGLSPQPCLYFQSFWGSKLLNGCLVVLPSNQYLQGII